MFVEETCMDIQKYPYYAYVCEEQRLFPFLFFYILFVHIQSKCEYF